MARCPSKTNELREIDSVGCKARNHHQKWEIDNFKIVTFIIIFGRNNIIEMDKCKSKNAALIRVFSMMIHCIS